MTTEPTTAPDLTTFWQETGSLRLEGEPVVRLVDLLPLQARIAELEAGLRELVETGEESWPVNRPILVRCRALLAPAQEEPRHGPWCVQNGDDSATPFVHGEACRRASEGQDQPARDPESPAP